jgi:hypothetical protein
MLPPNAGSERKNADIKYIGEMLFPARRRLAGAGGRLFPPSLRPNIPRTARMGPMSPGVRLPTGALLAAPGAPWPAAPSAPWPAAPSAPWPATPGAARPAARGNRAKNG